MTTAGTPLPLPQHLEDLRRSGLSDEQVALCGFRSESDPEVIRQLLGWRVSAECLGPCLTIPYRGGDGNFNGYCRLKPDRPLLDEKGKPRKYEAPKRRPVRAYFPPGTLQALANPQTLVLITEGEKKGAKLAQEGFCCVALPGVYAWQIKRRRNAGGKAEGPRELIDDLAAISWQGRQVILLFDSDAAENCNVRWAEVH
jgi:putative DNA primase/helicase